MLNFHPDKNKHMKISRSNVDKRAYTMQSTIITTRKEKNIGVMIDDKLTFSDHLAEKINRANSILGITRRTFVYLDLTMLKALYTALVEPHLEYANQIWCLYLVKNVEAIENVQRHATRMVPQLKGLNYKERLRKLDLPTLAYRRLRGNLIEVYKIITHKYDPDCTREIFKMRGDTTTRMKIFKTGSRLNTRKYTFSNRVVNHWNDLPEWVVNAESVKIESNLD